MPGGLDLLDLERRVLARQGTEGPGQRIGGAGGPHVDGGADLKLSGVGSGHNNDRSPVQPLFDDLGHNPKVARLDGNPAGNRGESPRIDRNPLALWPPSSYCRRPTKT